MYLKRHISPNQSAKIKQQGKITGLWLEKEYKRFYPAGEVAGHLVGFTNVDDQGQEGLEYMLEEFLLGEDGSKLVNGEEGCLRNIDIQYLQNGSKHGLFDLEVINDEFQQKIT